MLPYLYPLYLSIDYPSPTAIRDVAQKTFRSFKANQTLNNLPVLVSVIWYDFAKQLVDHPLLNFGGTNSSSSSCSNSADLPSSSHSSQRKK